MTSILHPPVEGAAFDAFLQNSAPDSRDHRKWQPEDDVMPALYLSHGAPPVFTTRTGWTSYSPGRVLAEANGHLDRERPLGRPPRWLSPRQRPGLRWSMTSVDSADGTST